MEGEKDDIPIRESEYKEAFEKLKKINDELEFKLQTIEQARAEIIKSIDEMKDEPVVAGRKDDLTEDVTNYFNQFMIEELNTLREFKNEMNEKFKELGNIFDIDNESVLAGNKLKFWKLAAEIAGLHKFVFGEKLDILMEIYV